MKLTNGAALVPAPAPITQPTASSDNLIFGSGYSESAPAVRDITMPWPKSVNAAGSGDLVVGMRHSRI